MTAHTFARAQGALMAHLDKHAVKRTLSDVVRDMQLVQAALMYASPSSRNEAALRRRLANLAQELSTRTGGTLTAGPL